MGAWKMLQAEEADDFVLATGRTHSVRDLCECAFSHVDLDYRDYVREGGAPARQHETKPLVGDAAKAVERLGWGPSISFHELIRLMVDADLDRHKRLNGGGG
jgi:GDPmannose 4,6-dehydratase